MENILIDSDGNMDLIVDSQIKIYNIITGLNNITLRRVNVKPNVFDEMFISNDQFNEKKITPIKFYSMLLNKKHPFCDGNGTTCKILFANNDKIIKLIDRTKNLKKLIWFHQFFQLWYSHLQLQLISKSSVY